ncbi:MAG: hypothetical protein IPN84_11380 [Sphingomonadales bacterium]|nr:hypothetical protein [Sphingomonadales bacterium]
MALQFGDAVQCTFTNTPYPHLQLRKALGAGGRLFNTDQFTMTITTGATTVATTSTTGTGTTVTNGATALTQVSAGTGYSMGEAASGTTALTNANGSSATALPTAVPGPITPALGDVITNSDDGEIILHRVRPDQWLGPPGAMVNYAITVSKHFAGRFNTASSTMPATVTYNNGFTVMDLIWPQRPPACRLHTPAAGLEI